MLLHYGLYVDVPLPLSQLVSLSSNSEQDYSDSIMRIDSTR